MSGWLRLPGRDVLALTRPHQWAKSLLVVPLPLLYPAAWTVTGVGRLVAAVVVFVLASAAVYVGNDVIDRDRDRRHPTKRTRPIAAGRVPVSTAVAVGVGLLAAAGAVTTLVEPLLALPVGAYVILNMGYSLRLKHVPVLELFVVASGFPLRIVAGCLAVGISPWGWEMSTAFLLCLMLLLGKRRREVELRDAVHRPVLAAYSARLLDQLLILSAGLAAATFLLFLADGLARFGNLGVLLLLPLILLGLFRYIQLVTVTGGGADPVSTLLRDPVIVVDAMLCVVIVVVLRVAASGMGGPFGDFFGR